MKIDLKMFSKIFLNNKGLSLIEVLVTGAMALVVSLGVATMMQNSFKEQKRVILLDTLRNQKAKFETMWRDQSVWTATLNNNAAQLFQDLEAGVSATEVPYTSPIEFQTYNADNSLALDLLGPSPTGSGLPGFTEKGTACTTFDPDAGQGNDECPFSYALLVGADCATTAACTNPQLKLVARLVFNPAPNGTLMAYKNMLGEASRSSIADTVVDSKYDAVVKRSSATMNRSFRIVSGITPTVLGCTVGNAGGGTCTTSMQVHPLTTAGAVASGLWSEGSAQGGYDNYNLVTIPGASGRFRFNETGFYGCVISVPAFATQNFSAALYNETSGAQVAMSSVTAGLWVQATTVIEAKFNVTSTTDNYQVHQRCQALPGGTPSANACTLGFATNASYGAGFFPVVSVTCYKMDKAM